MIFINIRIMLKLILISLKNINSLKEENKQLKIDMKNIKDPETIKE